MSKKEEIFLGTCCHIIKEDFLKQGKPISGNEKDFLDAVEKLFKAAMERKILELPDEYQK